MSVTTLDVMGRRASIDYQKDGSSELFTYWPSGQLKTVSDQHGITEYYYDAGDRLSTELKPSAVRLDYAYDAVGNRTQAKVTNGADITVTDYGYDNFNRLETVTDSSGITAYSYDAAGNLDTVTYPNGLVADYESIGRINTPLISLNLLQDPSYQSTEPSLQTWLWHPCQRHFLHKHPITTTLHCQ